MSSKGYIQVHAYASRARIPLDNAAVSITSPDGTALAMRLTDESGKISPVELDVPPLADSQTPDPPEQPFAAVCLNIKRAGYQQIQVRGIQVFPGITTNQNLEMIPLAELPGVWNQGESFDTPFQNL